MLGFGFGFGFGFSRYYDTSIDFTNFWNDRAKRREAQQRALGEEVKTMHSMEELQDHIEQLTLMNMALWSILKEKLGVTDELLVARLKEIDAADGTVDGKVTHQQLSECPQCHHPLSANMTHCLYCGYTPPLDVFGTTNSSTVAAQVQHP